MNAICKCEKNFPINFFFFFVIRKKISKNLKIKKNFILV
jgi:hypothetical protein